MKRQGRKYPSNYVKASSDKLRAAQNPETSMKELEELAKDSDSAVRQAAVQTIYNKTIGSRESDWTSSSRTSDWPDEDYWEDHDTIDAYDDYLGDVEWEVFDELGLDIEQNTQGRAGSIDLFWADGRPGGLDIPYGEWLDEEGEIAYYSSSRDQFKEGFKSWIESLINRFTE